MRLLALTPQRPSPPAPTLRDERVSSPPGGAGWEKLSHSFQFLKSGIFFGKGLDRFLLICPSCPEGNTPAGVLLGLFERFTRAPVLRHAGLEFAGLVSLPSIVSRQHEIGPREYQNGGNQGRCDKSLHGESIPRFSHPSKSRSTTRQRESSLWL